MAPLTVSRADGVALVTLNRPAKRNALSIELRERLMEELAALAHDDDVRCASSPARERRSARGWTGTSSAVSARTASGWWR